MNENGPLQKALILVQRLNSRTQTGAIRWAAPSTGDGFECLVAGYKMRLRLIPDENFPDKPDFALTVIDDATGREVDQISNVTLRPIMDRVQQGRNPYQLLAQLYETARRQALGVDDAIQSILGALGEG